MALQKANVKNALSIGSVFGIPIRLHISLLIAVVLLSIFSGAGLLAILILAVGIFGSVALHELGHSVVARAKGSYIHEIVLYPFGGAAKISNIPKRPMDEVLVALAGPAVSLALALLFRQIEWLAFLGYLNGMLFFFKKTQNQNFSIQLIMLLKRCQESAVQETFLVGALFLTGVQFSLTASIQNLM